MSRHASRNSLPNTHANLFLALEPRFMFDAAGVATGAEVASQQAAQQQVDLALPSTLPAELPLQAPATEHAPADAAATETADIADDSAPADNLPPPPPKLGEALGGLQTGDNRQEIVFIDTRVADYQSLLNGIAPNAQVVLLDSGSDGIEQIANTLANYQQVDAIHLISHGSAGQISLGAALLNADSMQNQYAEALRNIGNALSSDADILIYGCDFAAGSAGLQAVQQLAELTGADVAASNDATGHAATGGNWVLESHSGQIETALAISLSAQDNYAALLADSSISDSNASDTRITAEDNEIAITGLAINDGDNPASMTLRIQTSGGTARIDNLGAAIVSQGSNGGTDFTLSGSRDQLNAALATLHFNPFANQNSSTADYAPQIVLTAIDITNNGNTATRTVNNLVVTAVNDAPNLSTQTALTVAEGGNSSFSLAQLAVNGNALDPDIASGQQVLAQQMVQITSLPGKGTLTYKNGVVAIGAVVPVTDLADLRYTHNGNDIASADTDSFNITVSDGGGAATNGSITINLTPVNVAPSISATAPSLIEGQVKTVAPTINLGDSFDTLADAIIVIDNIVDAGQGTLFIDANNNNIVDAGEALTDDITLDATQAANLATQLKFFHNGAEPNAPGAIAPSYRISVTDVGGGTGTPSATVSIEVSPNDDDPTLSNSHSTQDTPLDVTEGVSVIITNAMLQIADADRDPANTANTTPTNQLVYTIGAPPPTQGEIQVYVGDVLGLIGPENDGWIVLGEGGRFTQAQVDAGQVRYYQTTDVSTNTQDSFSFTVRDSAFGYDVWTDPANPASNREGGLRDSPTGIIATQSFHLNITADDDSRTNDYIGPPRPATSGFGGQNMVYSFTPTGGMPSNNSVAGGSWMEADGGNVITSAMLSYTITRTDTKGTPDTSDDDSVVVPAAETVYTLTAQAPNGVVQRNVGGSWVDIPTNGQFTQQDIDTGKIRFVHDGSEDHLSSFTYTVSDGTPNHYTSTFGLDITPTNDRPGGSGGSAQVVEGNNNSVRLGSNVLEMSDIDNSLDGKGGEGAIDFLWFKITGLAVDGGSNPRGTLERWNGSAWVAVDVNTWLPSTLLTASADGGTSGLRYRHDGSEPLAYSGGAKVTFNYVVRDDLTDPGDAFATDTTAPADTSGSQQSNQSAGITATVNIIPVNNPPLIGDKPGDSDPDISAQGTIAGGGATVGKNEILTDVPEGGSAIITSALLTAVDPDNTTVQRQYRIMATPTQGTLLLSGKALGVGSTFTQDDIDNNRLSYRHNGSEVGSLTTDGLGSYNDKFHFVVNDGVLEDNGAGAGNYNTFLITLTRTNDAPTLSAPGGPINIDSAIPANNLVSGFVVADPDLTDGVQDGETDFVQVTVRILQANDNRITDYATGFGGGGVSIGYATPADTSGLWAVTRDGNNDILQIQGTRQQVNAALAGLTVTFANDLDTRYKVQVIADDRIRNSSGALTTTGYDANGGELNQAASAGDSPTPVPNTIYDWATDIAVPTSDGNIVARTVDIRASSVNDPAVFTGPASVTVNEDLTTKIGGAFVVSDPESAAFGTPVTVTVSVPSGSGTLNVGTPDDGKLTPAGGQAVTIAGDNSNSITLTGRAADIQALLNGRNFANTANDPDSGLFYTSPADVNHDLNGGGAAGDVTLTLTFNDNGSRIGDDVGGGSVANNPANVLVSLDITAVNDAPTVQRTATTVTIASTEPTAVSGFSISDVDNDDGYANGETDFMQVTVRLLDNAGTPLTAANYLALGITLNTAAAGHGATVDGSLNGVNGALELRGTLSQINAYLAGLQVGFANNVDANYRLEVVADDRLRDLNSGALTSGANGGANNQASEAPLPAVPTTDTFDPYATTVAGYGLFNVSSDYRPLQVASINDPGVITASNVSVDESAATLLLNAGNANISIADPDDNGAATMTTTVTLSTGTISAVGGAGGAVAGIGTGSITITGATEAQINSRLQALTVSFPDPAGSATAADWNGSFTVTVVYNDAGNTGVRPDSLSGDTNDPAANPGDYSYADGSSNILITTRTFTVTVNAVNDAPTRSDGAPVVLPAVNEDTANPAGSTVSDLFGGKFVDALDEVNNGSAANSLAGIAITSNNAIAAQGKWQYSSDGTTWTDLPAVSTANALLLQTTDQLRFLPAADFHGTPGGLSVRLVDDSNGAITTGSMADVTTSGGTTPYSDSSNAVTLSTTVTNLNDRPTGSNTTLTAIAEDTTNPPGATVAALGFGYGDTADNQTAVTGGGNAATAFGGIAIVGNAADAGTQGVWQYNTGSGWVDIAATSDTAALLLPTTAQLRFLPNADYNGTPGALTLRVSDTAVAFDGGSDISGDLGVTSQWSNTLTLGTNVTPLNDAPTLSHTATNPTVVQNTSGVAISPVALLNSGTVGDIDLSTTAALSPGVFGGGSITATLTDGIAGDELVFDSGFTLPAGVTASGGAGSTPLVISLDNDTTPAEVKAILEAIRYRSTNDNLTVYGTDFSRNYQIVLSDGNNVQAGGNAGGPPLSAPAISGTITITPTNHTPVNVLPAAPGTSEDTPLTITGLSVSDVDNLQVTTTLSIPTGSGVLDVVTGGGATISGNGSGTVTLVGTPTQVNAALASVTYTPTADFNSGSGTINLTISSSDGIATDTDTLAITVTPVVDITPETLTTAEDTPISFNPVAGTNGAVADSFEGGSPQITAINGQAISEGGSVAVSNGTVTLGAGNVLTFTPAQDFNGVVPTFTYTVSSGGVTETANIDITVTPMPDPPVAVDNRFIAIPGQAINVVILGNDSDPDGDDLTVTAINGTPIAVGDTIPVAHGTVTLNPNGTLTFMPAAGFAGDFQFSYTITDGNGGFAVASVFGLIADDTIPPDNLWNADGFIEPLPPLKLPVVEMQMPAILPVVKAVNAAADLNGMTAIGDRAAHPIMQTLQRLGQMSFMGDRLQGWLGAFARNRGGDVDQPLSREIDRIEHLFAYDDLVQRVSDSSRSSWDVGGLRHSVTVIPRETHAADNSDFLSVHTTRTGALLYVELEHTVDKLPSYDVRRFDVRLANGRPLPPWLSFDAGSGVATGVPPAGGEIVRLKVAVELADGRVLSNYVEIETDTARIVELKSLHHADGASRFSDQVTQSAGHFDAEAARLRHALGQ